MDPCIEFRDRWLEAALEPERRAALEAGGHTVACASCAEWLRSMHGQVRALTSLARVDLPEHLARAVEVELENPSSTVERALRSLPARRAPDELSRLVAGLLDEPAEEEEPAAASRRSGEPEPHRSVRVLEYHLVPPVLERLVSEDLADPDGALAERMVGNLPTLRAPDRLRMLVRRDLERPAVARVLTWASVAAAAAIAWLLVRAEPGRDPLPRRHVDAGDLAQVDPVARRLLGVLSGGVLPEEPR